jgi:hypothetical protein
MIVPDKSIKGWMLSEEALKWITDNIPFNSIIVELGSGFSTKILSRDYKIFSVEEDLKWVGFEPDSTYIYSPLKKYPNDIPTSTGWYEDSLFNFLPKKYDFLIVDGPKKQNRGNFINFCELFDRTVPFLIDDTDRAIDKEMALGVSEKLNKKIFEFKSSNKEFMILI